MRYRIFLLLVFFVSFAFTRHVAYANEIVAIEEDAVLEVAACLSAEITINEVDYDQPNTDTGEFIELSGADNGSLTGLELHLLNGSSDTYQIVDLSGESLSSTGYFVIGNASSIVDVLIPNGAIQNTRGGIGLYDTTSSTYCNFVNYEGTVPGFEGWLNIGEDSFNDGELRGCSRSGSGWWSCDKPTTPGAANGVVAVGLGSAHTTASFSGLIIIVALLLTMATASIRPQK